MTNEYDNPLEVHKSTDDSYNENPSNLQMSSTKDDSETEEQTLERHRFKKEKKNSRWPVIIILLFVIVIACAVLFKYGNFGSVSTKEKSTTEVTTEVNQFLDTVTIQGSDLFFEGEWLEGGYSDLYGELKYFDGTSIIIQNEHANANFLTEVEELATSLNLDYDVKIVQSTGLVPSNETTTSAESIDSATNGETTTQSE